MVVLLLLCCCYAIYRGKTVCVCSYMERWERQEEAAEEVDVHFEGVRACCVGSGEKLDSDIEEEKERGHWSLGAGEQ